MVIYGGQRMNKKILYGLMFGAILNFTACDGDKVDNVEFELSIANDVNNIHVGDAVKFMFAGNADYISFYSGDQGNNYENKDRTDVELKSLEMSTTIKQQYTDLEYRNEEMVFAYISEDFKDDYSITGIKNATWTKISGQEFNQIRVPLTSKAPSETVSSKMDLSAYKNKEFYVAFQYNAPKRKTVPEKDGNGRYVVAPRIDVTPCVLEKETSDGQLVKMDNTASEWAFNIVYENSAKKGTYLVNDAGLLFQPQKGKEHTDDDVIVWMVSQKISPSAVEPDRGTPIKTIEAKLSSYSYVYHTPGTYTATFVATNANMWNSKQVVKTIRFDVKP